MGHRREDNQNQSNSLKLHNSHEETGDENNEAENDSVENQGLHQDEPVFRITDGLEQLFDLQHEFAHGLDSPFEFGEMKIAGFKRVMVECLEELALGGDGLSGRIDAEFPISGRKGCAASRRSFEEAL